MPASPSASLNGSTAPSLQASSNAVASSFTYRGGDDADVLWHLVGNPSRAREDELHVKLQSRRVGLQRRTTNRNWMRRVFVGSADHGVLDGADPLDQIALCDDVRILDEGGFSGDYDARVFDLIEDPAPQLHFLLQGNHLELRI
jgi:hypothetical protein